MRPPASFQTENVLTSQSFLNRLKFRLFITILSLGVQWKVVRRSLRMAVFADHLLEERNPWLKTFRKNVLSCGFCVLMT
jgi:hypothetical protein